LEAADLRPGITVQGPKWPEPVEIKKVETSGEYVNIIGATTISNQHVDQLLRLEELSQVSIVVLDDQVR